MNKEPKFDFKYDLLETHFMPDKYKVLISCILLNRTTRKQVDKVIYRLFDIYPTADDLSRADQTYLKEMIRPLGFYNRRSKTLIEFSKSFANGFNDVKILPGVGEYAYDAYRILFLNDMSFEPKDKALKNFIKFIDKDFTICPCCYEQLQYLDQCKWCGWSDIAKEWRWNILTLSLKSRLKQKQKLQPMMPMMQSQRQLNKAHV